MKTLLSFVLFFTFSLIFFISVVDTQAASLDCNDPANKDKIECKFGTIIPPAPIADFITGDKTGATGISKFLSNLVVLIFSIATIALIFMILWGAFEWLTSGGDKEKLSSAQKRIINAIIGIILFAVAFAVINVLGQFTGFTFFGPNSETCKAQCYGNPVCARCPTGRYICNTTDASQCAP